MVDSKLNINDVIKAIRKLSALPGTEENDENQKKLVKLQHELMSIVKEMTTGCESETNDSPPERKEHLVLDLQFPNAVQNARFDYPLKGEIPKVFESKALMLEAPEQFSEFEFKPGELIFSGIPRHPGKHTFKLTGKGITLNCSLLVNPDPKLLWKNIPSKQEVKADNVGRYYLMGGRKILAGSRRGISHANDGSPRQDHFLIHNVEDWIIAVVCDGAGSAKHSDIGSKLTAENVTLELSALLSNNLEKLNEMVVDESGRPELSTFFLDLFSNAFKTTYTLLDEHSKTNQWNSIKDLSATLNVALLKYTQSDLFICGFTVGDGLVCTYQPKDDRLELFMEQDSGEYSGQTRFFTNTEIVLNKDEIQGRIRFDWLKGEHYVILATDGIADPVFGTEDRLKDVENWKDLIEKIQDIYKSPDPDIELLNWLTFYQQGEYDDRTLVIID